MHCDGLLRRGGSRELRQKTVMFDRFSPGFSLLIDFTQITPAGVPSYALLRSDHVGFGLFALSKGAVPFCLLAL